MKPHVLFVCHPTPTPQDPAAEARMKVACITEQVLTLVNKRIGLYRHFDETINRYKQSRDASTLSSGRKSLEAEHKALTSEIAQLQSRLKTEGSDLCDRVSVCHPLGCPMQFEQFPGCSFLVHSFLLLRLVCRRRQHLGVGLGCGANPVWNEKFVGDLLTVN